MQEASETQTWLEFCCACNYIGKEVYEKLYTEYEQILAMLNTMDIKADTFCFPSSQPPNFPSSWCSIQWYVDIYFLVFNDKF